MDAQLPVGCAACCVAGSNGVSCSASRSELLINSKDLGRPRGFVSPIDRILVSRIMTRY